MNSRKKAQKTPKVGNEPTAFFHGSSFLRLLRFFAANHFFS